MCVRVPRRKNLYFCGFEPETSLFGEEKKPPRADAKAQQLVSLVVLDPKWVAMARFGLRLGQNESRRNQAF